MSSADDNQRASFETLLRPHLDRLYRLAYRLSGNKPEAEDLFQDVLTKVFPRLDSLIEIEEPGSWLCRIMYNHFIDDRRRYARQRLVAVPEDQLPGQGIESVAGDLSPEDDALRRDDVAELEDALRVLSEEHRMIVLLHDCEGYKLHEIQDLMDIPVGTLKSRLHRARARLRKILEANGTISSI
jgi:RNA polymerase sigma-70 factor (ECF subfamily)